MHGFKYEFSKIYTWGGAHQAPLPRPFTPLNLGLRPGFGLHLQFSGMVLRALSSVFALNSPPSNMFINSSGAPCCFEAGYGPDAVSTVTVIVNGAFSFTSGVHRGSVLESLEKAYPVFDNELDFSSD